MRTILPALVLSAAAAADDLLEEAVRAYVAATDFKEVLVSAKRTPEYEVPLNATSGRSALGPREIRESGQSTVQDVLRQVPGLRFYDESGSDSKPNFGLRGLDPNRSINVALLVDGIPMEPAPYGHPGKSLFPLALERAYAIEVYRGGYSVPYGPNTVAGVINFMTRPIPETPEVEVRQRLGSHGETSTYVGGGGTHGDWGALIEGVYKSGATHRENGDYEIQNYGGKFSWQALENLVILLQLEHYDDDSRLAGGLTTANFEADPYQSDNDEDFFAGWQTRGNVRARWTFAEDQVLELLTYVYQGNRAFWLGRPNHYGDTPASLQATPRPMTVWAFQPQYFGRFEALGARHEVWAGVRYHRESIDIDQYTETWPTPGTVTTSVDQHFNYLAWSLFLQDTIRIGERWTVVPGVRAEIVDIGARNNLTSVAVDRDFDAILPAISASYLVRPDWSLFANFQTSFRSPAYNYIEISAKPQTLDTESAEVYEVGSRGEWRSKGLFAAVTLFLIDFHDKLEVDPNEDNVYSNIGEARHSGVELEWAWSPGAIRESLAGLAFRGSWSYVDAEVRSGANEGNEMRHAPRNQLFLECRYDHASGFWGGIDGLYVGDSFSDEANTVDPSANGNVGLNPDYWLCNVRIGYGRAVFSNRGRLEFEAGVNNLFETSENWVHREGKGVQKGIDRVYYGLVRLSFGF
jgi:Fe(3+) dicitrate transport protein